MKRHKTREGYWNARGRQELVNIVRRQTIAELEGKGIVPDSSSAVYKKTFDRFAGRYLREQGVQAKQRRKLSDEWIEEHKDDTDEQLLAYLRSQATDPEKVRKPGRVIGGYFINHRFGSWKNTLERAGLLEFVEKAQKRTQE